MLQTWVEQWVLESQLEEPRKCPSCPALIDGMDICAPASSANSLRNAAKIQKPTAGASLSDVCRDENEPELRIRSLFTLTATPTCSHAPRWPGWCVGQVVCCLCFLGHGSTQFSCVLSGFGGAPCFSQHVSVDIVTVHVWWCHRLASMAVDFLVYSRHFCGFSSQIFHSLNFCNGSIEEKHPTRCRISSKPLTTL